MDGCSSNSSKDQSYPKADMNDNCSLWPIHNRYPLPHVWHPCHPTNTPVFKKEKDIEKIRAIILIENQLEFLSYEWTILSIIYDSVRNAYLINTPFISVEEACRQTSLGSHLTRNPSAPLPSEYSTDAIEEIKFAIYELDSQLKQLDKKIGVLENERCKWIGDGEESPLTTAPILKKSGVKRRVIQENSSGVSKRSKIKRKK